MKTIFTKLLFTFYILHFSFFISYAQWTDITPPTGNWLKDIACPAVNICYVVGNDGTVFKTIDGGNIWQLKNSGIDINESYFAIYCFDANTCIIGQGNSAMYKTIDGADSWYPVNFPFGFGGVLDIHFANDSVGYIPRTGGGDYLKTVDAGENWTWESTLISSDAYKGVYFINENIGFLAGGSLNNTKIVKTINGGSSWSWSLNKANGGGLASITCPSDSVCYAVGTQTIGGVIYRTIDQGNNWDSIFYGGGTLLDIYCLSIDTCYAVGGGGTVVYTSDGFNTWSYDTVGVPLNYNLMGVDFPSSNVGYIAGEGPIALRKGTIININKLPNLKSNIFFYPNPVTDKAVIYYLPSSVVKEPLKWELYDVMGKQVAGKTLYPGATVFQRNKLSSGIYICRVVHKGVTLLTDKIVVN